MENGSANFGRDEGVFSVGPLDRGPAASLNVRCSTRPLAVRTPIKLKMGQDFGGDEAIYLAEVEA